MDMACFREIVVFSAFIGIFSTWLMGLLEKLAVPQERVILFKVFQRKGKGAQA